MDPVEEEIEAPDDSEIPESAFSALAQEDPDESTGTPPLMTSKGSQSTSPEIPKYWHAAISGLPKEKQEAAWRFYHEHELDRAGRATDVLTGLVLLMEANGLYMDGCAKSVSETLDRLTTLATRNFANRPPAPQSAPVSAPQVPPRELLAAIEAQADRLAGIAQQLASQPPAAGNPALLSPAPEIAGVSAKRGAAPWLFALLLGLAGAGAGTYLANRHFAAEADANTQAEVRGLKTWLGVEEEAKAILMSRKAQLVFDLSIDPVTHNKVYSLSVKGTKIDKAFVDPNGTGVIQFADPRR